MSKQTKTPNYIKIAVDIAHRIVNNQFSEGERITGRTTLVSIYNVSPETIRILSSFAKRYECCYYK